MATKARSKSAAKTRAATKVPAGYRRWDATNYLKSEDDMAGYLEAAMEEAPDDPAHITAVLNDIARARGIMKLASDAGMTRAGLEAFVRDSREDQQGARAARLAAAGGLKHSLPIPNTTAIGARGALPSRRFARGERNKRLAHRFSPTATHVGILGRRTSQP